MVEPTHELLHHWTQNGKKIHKLHMDNAGENKKLELRSKGVVWKNPVVTEYTARGTPKQNSPVEVGFYALANKAHATMHHVNLPMEMQYRLFGESFTTVTLLDGLTVIEWNGKHTSQYNHFFGEMPGFAQNLQTVGEAGTKTKMDTTPKLEGCGVHCLFVGYSLTHPTWCYRMYNPKNAQGVHFTCCWMCSTRKQTLWVN